ncbi:RmlC-like cupin domain-containing protein [Naematelia encephala]|uniref:RmlC-like cupin domain-containing protein n=1 Tax=Naematelia encephala TaxID=71784 RepID=A0A1Y2BJN2_9TREE|nr:RmlC-like cupin domain-containing protein [Naematelia encephala]
MIRISRSLQKPTTSFKAAFTMSTTSTAPLAESSRTVVKSVYAQEVAEGVGATVRRSLGSGQLRNLSPFLMLDQFKASRGSGFPDHPHRGQSTITYVLQGYIQHEDFVGNTGFLGPGDVQWMTAGRGIMHSEMPYWDPDPEKAVDPEGLQLWVDLPADKKFIEPSYQEKKAKDITTIDPKPGVQITIISGESHGATGFVRPVGGCWYFDFRLSEPGAEVFQPIPEGWTSFVYLIDGPLQLESSDKVYTKHHTLVLSSSPSQTGVLLRRPASAGPDEPTTRFILVAGQPLDQEVRQMGPFVLNTERQVREAIMDFRMGRNGFERAPGWKSEIGKAMLE